jgi:hypothetical protein
MSRDAQRLGSAVAATCRNPDVSNIRRAELPCQYVERFGVYVEVPLTAPTEQTPSP